MRVLLLARLAAAHRDEPRRARIQAYAEEALRLARELGDPPTLAIAFEAWFAVTEAPDRVREALDACPEIVGLSDRVGDAEHAYTVHDFVFNLRWKVADRTGVDTEFERLRHLAAELRQPPHQWAFGTAQTLVALLDGRLQDAERLIEETLALGRAAVSWNAEVTHRIALFALRRHQGRLAELDDMMSRSVLEYPALMRFSCALAHLHAELERPDEARALVDELLAHDLPQEHLDAEWLFSMCVLADAAAVAGPDAAQAIYDTLLPFERLYAQAPVEAPFGAVARALGVLARAAERPNDAVRHFESAVQTERRMRARPWIAHAQHGLGTALLTRGAPGDADRGGAVLAEARRAYATLGMYSWARRCLTDAGTSPPI
jgi:tetratricopeptide (TPR) repeat protein